MDKIKEWFKPTKHKIIASIVAIGLVASSVTIYSLSQNKIDEPSISFVNEIVFEYGQKSFSTEDADGKIIEEVLPVITPEQIVDKAKSSFEEVSFNKIPVNGQAMTMEFRSIDTSTVGEHEGLLFAKLGNIMKEFKFNYTVVDTNVPKLNDIEDITITQGDELSFNFKATDIIDGELEVKVEGDYDVNVAGVYELKAVAEDHNKNKVEVPFTLTVVEKELAVVDEPNNNESNETPGNGNSNQGSNNKPNTPSGGGSSGSGGTSPQPEKPTEPEKPIEPPKPIDPPPFEEDLGDFILYKDYGSYAACSAVIDEVTMAHAGKWKRSICADGKLYYKPK